jgi:hypothetical protein
MNFAINPRRVTQILLAVIVALVLLSVAGQYYKYFVGHDPALLKLAAKLDLDGEENCLPTWYQVCTLFACFIGLGVITLAKRARQDRWTRRWGFLALAFLYLSLDESVSVHEQLNGLGHWFKNSIIHDLWVVPALLAVGVFGLAYLKFLRALPSRTRVLFVVAGGVYVFGAAGMEIISGHYLDLHQASLVGGENFTYKMLDTVEETLEMLGVLIFLYAQLDYLERGALVPALVGRRPTDENQEYIYDSLGITDGRNSVAHLG